MMVNTSKPWAAKALGAALVLALLDGCGAPKTPPVSGPGGTAAPGDQATGSRVGVTASQGASLQALSGSSCRAFTKSTVDQGVGIQVKRVFSGLANGAPVAMLQPPGTTALWALADLFGTIVLFPDRTDVKDAEKIKIFDISQTIYAENEAGLLGFTYDPDYATNRRAYVVYTTQANGSLSLNLSRLTADASHVFGSPPDIILTIDAPNNFHLGGNIAFGLDGMLYFGVGFGQTANDASQVAQDLSDLHGKMLRLDVTGQPDSGLNYAIPADNPFVDVDGARSEIFARGFRNPWRWSIDSTSGLLWAGDVGGDNFEEIDIVRAGGNYGWPAREGLSCNTAAGISPCTVPDQQDPIYAYSHQQGSCVTGGYVYRGTAIVGIKGHYIFSDCLSGTIWGLAQTNADAPEVSVLASNPAGGVTSMAQSAAGELFLLSRDSTIYQIQAIDPATSETYPTTLSTTGCVTPSDISRPVDKMFPYDVAVGFWSDRADKARWLSLPANSPLSIDSQGNIISPPGSVYLKRFFRNGKFIETRLLMRFLDGTWGGLSYEWNDAATEANLVPSTGATRILEDGTKWKYPSRGQCLTCHSEAAGATLGMQVAQLNHTVDDFRGSGSGNQFAGLVAADLLRKTGQLGDLSVPAYVDLTASSVDLDLRARTYLEVNCASCHRPGGQGLGGLDLRLATPASALGLCGQAPTYGDFGLQGAKLLVPGRPDLSVMSVRMKAMDDSRMPAISSDVVDDAGVHLIDAWISAKTACP